MKALVQKFGAENLQRLADVLEEAKFDLVSLEEEQFEIPVGADPLEEVIDLFVEAVYDEMR